MNKKRNLAGLLLSIVLIACSCNQRHSIDAIIIGLGSDTILIEYVPVSKFYEMEEPFRDTIYSKKDHFSFDIPYPEPIILFMFPKKGEYKRADGSYYRPNEKGLVLLLKTEDKINIQGELNVLYLKLHICFAHVDSNIVLLFSKL